MKPKYFKILFYFTVLTSFSLSSCIGDLDANPIDPSVTMEFDQEKVFTKIYATLGLTGQKGPHGKGDVEDFDEGRTSFYRLLWYANELSSDECIVNSWGDPGLSSMVDCSWGASNDMVVGLYYRANFNITLCNFFLEQTEGMGDEETLRQRAETRFIRALNYFYMMDLYANPPFADRVMTENPQQISRADLFVHLEEELIQKILPDLAEPRDNTYGRVDKAAAWLLLARMYLNAEVYIGTTKWTEAVDYSNKVLSSGYALTPDYAHIFMADNGGQVDGSSVNRASQEIILPVIQHGDDTQNHGGTLFLIAGTRKAGMPDWGMTEQWAGLHCRESMVNIFFPNRNAPLEANHEQMIAAARDDRALMYSVGRTLSTNDNKAFEDGFACVKFTNLRADGASPSNLEFPDTDIPFMRLAEAHLTLAEASMRANGGAMTVEAKSAIDAVRNRANAPTRATYTLDDVLDEWAREFWFEGRRRMDLIRYNKYAGVTGYNWDWKGGTKEGTIIPTYRSIYPLPTNDLTANPNLKQNPGY